MSLFMAVKARLPWASVLEHGLLLHPDNFKRYISIMQSGASFSVKIIVSGGLSPPSIPATTESTLDGKIPIRTNPLRSAAEAKCVIPFAVNGQFANSMA